MRPRELRLKGFRSYREETRFDWRDRRLVGIVGPIGSGKSSILDAIAIRDSEAARAAMRTHLANSRERRRRAGQL